MPLNLISLKQFNKLANVFSDLLLVVYKVNATNVKIIINYYKLILLTFIPYNVKKSTYVYKNNVFYIFTL